MTTYDLATDTCKSLYKQECTEEIEHIFSHWKMYWPEHTPSTTRLETHTPKPIEQPCHELDYEALNWIPSSDEEEAVATATLADVDKPLLPIPSSTDSFLDQCTYERVFFPDQSAYEGVLDFNSTVSVEEDFSSLLQSTESLFTSLHTPPSKSCHRISPYKTILLDTAVATAFATEYYNPPIKATVKIKTMSWGALFYTLTHSLKHQLKQGQMLQFRGMLTSVWRAEENVCNHKDYEPDTLLGNTGCYVSG